MLDLDGGSRFRIGDCDQYKCLTLQQAAEAQKVLARNSEVHEFCAPCGDASSKPITIKLVEIGRVWEGDGATAYRATDGATFWEVIVNDEAIDLAYAYVRKGRATGGRTWP